jgi:hypothetical protein
MSGVAQALPQRLPNGRLSGTRKAGNPENARKLGNTAPDWLLL